MGVKFLVLFFLSHFHVNEKISLLLISQPVKAETVYYVLECVLSSGVFTCIYFYCFMSLKTHSSTHYSLWTDID